MIVLSFRNLQLQRIAQKQDELLRLANEIAREGGEIPEDEKSEADKQLQSYCESATISDTQYLLTPGTAEALRNYETLSSGALTFIPLDVKLIGAMDKTRIPRRPPLWLTIATYCHFMAYGPVLVPTRWKRLTNSSSTATSSAVKHLSLEVTSPILEKTIDLAAGDEGYRELHQHLHDQRGALLSRLFMAGFGGISLYIPMLIMTLNPLTSKSLFTILGATGLFGFLLAIAATDSAGKDVLAATAAYAGFLVIFAGSLPTPS